MRLVITGGAGFVGSSLALRFRQDHPDAGIACLDNLRRRGSELTIGRLRAAGIDFVHGDVRCPEDFLPLGAFDLIIDCSAEPSVHAGYGESPGYLVNTNLAGTINCLEAARRCRADLVFLSTSRVYPIEPLRALPLVRQGDRLVLTPDAAGPGWSAAGLTADFPLAGYRSLYGATKLASELLIAEYRAMYGLRAIINRCGVLCGPWQMGKVDQGFVVLWAARHLYRGRLAYSGFGGHGHQVRDILHVADLYDLLRRQLADLDRCDGQVFNAGGGPGCSLSLAELTRLCAARAGQAIEIGSDPETRPADIPYYVTDNRPLTAATGWQPSRSVATILDEIFDWLAAGRDQLAPILG